MSDLIKESIIDAKAVLDASLANAKTFLEENFATEVKHMFSEKLKEEMEEMGESEGTGNYGEANASEEVDSSKIGKNHGLTAKTAKSTAPAAVASKTSTADPKGQEFDVKLEEDATEVTSEDLDEILAELESEGGSEEEVPSEPSEPEGEKCDESDSEVSLDELLAELEEEEGAAAPVADPTQQAPAPAPVADPTQQPPAPAPVADPTQQPPAAPAVGQVPSPSEEAEGDVTAEEMAEALIALNEENESLKTKLSEAEDALKYVKGVLAESNLLNAKLLYTNKLFKNKNLTEEQKLKVINTFDLTKTMREVKLAYTVLAESFNAGASVVKKKTNATVKSITEGLASKPVSSTKPEPTIVEPQATEMALRFQKLAGIKSK